MVEVKNVTRKFRHISIEQRKMLGMIGSPPDDMLPPITVLFRGRDGGFFCGVSNLTDCFSFCAGNVLL